MSFGFHAAEEVCRINNPLDWTDKKVEVMVRACRELATFHYENSAVMRSIYERNGFDPSSIFQESDLAKIPSVHVAAMKTYLLLSMEPNQAVLKLTSSGTRGQKTQLWLDQASLDRAQCMLDGVWKEEDLVSDKLTNYVNFIYDPKDAQDLGISFSVDNEQRFAKPLESFFVVQKDEKGDWVFDHEKAISKLKLFASKSNPVRLLGIPSFMYELVTSKHWVTDLKLPDESTVITGGGWKAAEDKKISREEFRALLVKKLGLKDERIRDSFGMAEHAAPYMECSAHRFHIPVFCRVFVRDPIDKSLKKDGETGLLELLTPLNTMMPNLNILSTDLGYVDRSQCACGKNSPTFTMVGRGGKSKHKGCAISADELVKRGVK